MNTKNNKHYEAEFNKQPAKSVGTFDIEKLKDMANKSPRKRYRICLHHSTDHLTQEMIICLKGFNYFRPHKHPLMYSESYHLIEGALDVYLFDDNGKVTATIKLASPNFPSSEKRDRLYRLSKPIFHLVVPRTEWTIYHEVATGPFDKTKSVEYAPFAPPDDCNPEEAIQYCKKVTKDNTYLL